jgi:hypothetical protein
VTRDDNEGGRRAHGPTWPIRSRPRRGNPPSQSGYAVHQRVDTRPEATEQTFIPMQAAWHHAIGGQEFCVPGP